MTLSGPTGSLGGLAAAALIGFAAALGAAPSVAQDARLVIAPDLSDGAAADAPRRPVAVNRLEFDLGFVFQDETRGAHGVVYRLERPTTVGRQTIQLGFDHDGAAKIARLAMEISDNATINRLALTDAVEMLADALRPSWTDARANTETALATALDGWEADAPDQAHAIPTEDPAQRAALRLYPSRRMATIDLKPALPTYDLLDRLAVTRLLEDSTLVIRPLDGRPPYYAYHAPDRLLSGRAEGSQQIDTGTWRVAADGTYCVEIAPRAGWRCSALVDQGDGVYAMMDAVDGRPTGALRATVSFEPGNPQGLFVARVADVLAPEMALRVTAGHTEERIAGGGGDPVTTYYRPDGSFKVGPEEGRWNVLQDGRRCWKVEAPDPGNWRCAFLRESYGGVFNLIDEGGGILADALLQEGNPRGW
ncbi:MAG: hypothetical protein NXI21_06315 [Alphaproteobacteria bacterium]|nr:hypothetical protein [Alphaproteobacteria bacterium]